MAALVYEVSFKGMASPTLRAAFADCQVDVDDGVTLVRCSQPAMRSVIGRIEEFGLELVDVRLLAEHAGEPFTPP